jgi:hypothetical protein
MSQSHIGGLLTSHTAAMPPCRFEPFLRQALQQTVRNIDSAYVVGQDTYLKEFYVGFYNTKSELK